MKDVEPEPKPQMTATAAESPEERSALVSQLFREHNRFPDEFPS